MKNLPYTIIGIFFIAGPVLLVVLALILRFLLSCEVQILAGEICTIGGETTGSFVQLLFLPAFNLHILGPIGLVLIFIGIYLDQKKKADQDKSSTFTPTNL